MRKVEDISGQVFTDGDYWVKVLREVEPSLKPNGTIKRRRYECLCKCGNVFVTNRGSLLNGDTKSCGCKHKKNVATRRRNVQDLIGKKIGTDEHWIEILHELDDVVDKSGRNIRMVHCKCKCGNEFDIDLYAITRGRIISCGCARHKRSNSMFGEKFGDEKTWIIPFEDAESRVINGVSRRMVKCRCCCGNIFEARLTDVVSGAIKSCGCRLGSSSLGEERLIEVFKNMNINIKEQHKFNSYRNSETNRLLRFDFYVEDFGLLIEYDGDQHFSDKRGWTKEDMEMRIFRDITKDRWCVDNNMPLLRIPYTEYNKLNDEYLKNAINLAIKNSNNGQIVTLMNPKLYESRFVSECNRIAA